MTASSDTVPARQAGFRWRSFGSKAQDAVLICVTAVFVTVHAERVLVDQSITSVFFAIEQTLLLALFLTRRPSTKTSVRPRDWAVAALGGWLPLLMRPGDASVEWMVVAGAGIQLIGLGMTIVGFSYLGRSFGIVAAQRGLKVSGPYRFVRHPIYASHALTSLGFLLANPFWFNWVVFAIASSCQLLRIQGEERILNETSDYATYRQRVRFRVVPGLY